MKYIALDLDGTLLNSEHEITKVTKAALLNVQQSGYRLILCSGRSYNSMKSYAKELELAKNDGYIVCFNGGMAYEAATGKCLFKNEFTKAEVNSIYHQVAALFEHFVTYGDGTINAQVINERIRRSARIMQAKITNDVISASPKIVLEDSLERIEKQELIVKQMINQKFPEYNVFRSVPHLIEITPPGSDKGTGLKKLFAQIDASKELLLAFGDAENDLTMLAYADVGIAMGNAMSQVKAIADYITDSNDEDGIAKVLNKEI